eukprot:TRINITY_DN103315_c0_g1_i1.p1 TRINITY_DN103315_c0_g1~~TRINITY_DN103315_c0_g1_i1.p1  ORF type:complete len:749 (-),score=155.10 TRINITY_DN103315_c0_g1_i1:148-2394(-)
MWGECADVRDKTNFPTDRAPSPRSPRGLTNGSAGAPSPMRGEQVDSALKVMDASLKALCRQGQEQRDGMALQMHHLRDLMQAIPASFSQIDAVVSKLSVQLEDVTTKVDKIGSDVHSVDGKLTSGFDNFDDLLKKVPPPSSPQASTLTSRPPGEEPDNSENLLFRLKELEENTVSKLYASTQEMMQDVVKRLDAMAEKQESLMGSVVSPLSVGIMEKDRFRSQSSLVSSMDDVPGSSLPKDLARSSVASVSSQGTGSVTSCKDMAIVPQESTSASAALAARESDAKPLTGETMEKKASAPNTRSSVFAMLGGVRRPSVSKAITAVTTHKPHSSFELFMNHPWWEAVNLVIIFLNVVVLGIESDVMFRYRLNVKLFEEGNGPKPGKDWSHDVPWDAFEVVFLLWFTLEVVLNLAAQKGHFCSERRRWWNILDCVVVGFGWFDLISMALNVGTLAAVRMFRVLRVLRGLRAAPSLRGVRNMVISMSAAFQPLMWAFVIMFSIMYFCSLLILLGLTNEFEKRSATGLWEALGIDVDSRRMRSVFTLDESSQLTQIASHYDGLWRTIMTLFRCVSGGMEWSVAAEPITHINWTFGVIWTCYIAFMLFGILNVLTGIFCDAAMQAAQTDRSNVIAAQLEERACLVDTVRTIFEESDKDGSGHVTKDEFLEIIENEEMAAQLASLGVQTSEAQGLFELLDDDDSGYVEVEEFVTGILRLKGSAKAVDMVTLLYENKKILRKINKVYNALTLRRA